jgi:ABC-type lipoprotein export system ATPase subunit
MVTHDPRAAERAQRVLHLDKGKLVDDVAPGRVAPEVSEAITARPK